MIAGTKKTTKPTEKDSTTPRRGKIMNNPNPNSKGNNYFKQGIFNLFPFILIAIAITSS